MNNKNITIIIAVIAVATLCYFPINIGRDLQLKDMRSVYTVCNAQPASKKCADIQKSTSTEYLCNLSDNCWVEVK